MRVHEYDEYIREKFRELVEQADLLDKMISSDSSTGTSRVIYTRVVPPKWFKLPSGEYAIARGKEYMMECKLSNVKAQVFTSKPFIGSMSIGEVLDLDLNSIVNRSIFYCALNAVLRYLGLIKGTIHCRGEEPVKCAGMISKEIWNKHGDKPLLIIGYQPAIVREVVDRFSKVFVTDMDPVNIGKRINNVVVMDSSIELDLIDQVEIVLITGSSVINSTFWSIYDRIMEKKRIIYLYGVSGAGVSYLLDIPRLCYYSG